MINPKRYICTSNSCTVTYDNINLTGGNMAEEKPGRSEEDILLNIKAQLTKRASGTDLKEGKIYIVYEKKPKLSFQLFFDLLKSGKTGICVSRIKPETLAEEYGASPTIYIWLTSIPGKYHIPPTSIGILTRYVTELVHKNPGCVLILDGFETLVMNNKFLPAMRMIEMLYDEVVRTSSIVIVPVIKESLSEQELAYLTRNAEVIE